MRQEPGRVFQSYLRRGVPGEAQVLFRIVSSAVELKFNPYHDPENGRFTFGPGGVSHAETQKGKFDPANPRNHTTYAVKPGDTLTGIAEMRKGLRASDLAWLNRLSNPDKLHVGQQLMLPNQDYLDAGRTARTKFVDLAFYMDTHDGALPSNVAKPPSIEQQLDTDWQAQTRNGYNFRSDRIPRTREIAGTLKLDPNQRRSRSSQMNAGGADRLQTDHGGHYIARMFGGPEAPFNHFAQDASVNRGAYRALEDQWAKALKSGKEVMVKIVPDYKDLSLRPTGLNIEYHIDGQLFKRYLPNTKR